MYGVTYTHSDDDLTLTTTDRDANRRPLGLNLRITVAPDASGTDTLQLRLVRYATTEKRDPPAQILIDAEMAVAYRSQ